MTKIAIISVTLVALLADAQWIQAQVGNPPCGIYGIKAGSQHVDDRFIPSPPEHVKFALLRALPDVGWKVTKDKGFHLQGGKDWGLTRVLWQKNQREGVEGLNNGTGAMGKWTVDIREATQDGVRGSQLHVEFHSNKVVGRAAGTATLARPLGDMTACLAKLLSLNDPLANPRGLEPVNGGTLKPVTIPDGTSVTVLLRDPLYFTKPSMDNAGAAVNYEVANDVAVNGVVVIRRGALATAQFTAVEATKTGGRHAQGSFTVTAIDGQKIPVAVASDEARVHGIDALIPAGTSFDLTVSGEHTVGGH